MNAVAVQVTEELLGLAGRGSLLVAGYLVLRAMVGDRLPARWLFVGWLVVALRLVVPFGFATVWSPFNWTAFGPRHSISTPAEERRPAPPTSSLNGSAASNVPPVAARSDRAGAWLPWSWSGWLGVVWLAGFAGFAAARVVAARRIFRRWRRAARMPEAWVRALVADEARAAGVHRIPDLVDSAAVPVPAISGLWRATLWLPAGLAGRLGEADLRNVVRHELAHWRRRDPWTNELLALARALHWWNPLVWLAVRTARADCEVACDEFVMQRSASAEPSAYGASLLKVLGTAGGRTGTSAALGVFETRKQLKRRILMIANYRTPSRGRTLLGAAVAAAVLAVATTREARADDPAPVAVGAVTTTAPAGWWENGNATDKYVVGVDATQGRPAPAAYVKSTERTKDTFGGMMQTCDAKAYRGKRVRLSGLLKTVDAPKGACLWLRVDGADGKSLAFDNMQRQPVAGTKDWTPAEIVLEVPSEAATLNFGFFLMDTGQAWVSALAFAEAGPGVAPTGVTRPLPDRPTNLGFAPQTAP